MRFLLVDDHPLLLYGLRALLTASGYQVVGTAQDGHEALVQVRLLRPDVVLMDIRMPHCDGLCATRLIKAEFPEIRIVILSACDENDLLFDAIRNGASGYLLKGQDSDEFLRSLDELARGEVALAPGFAQRILCEFSRLAEPATLAGESRPQLSPRQEQILTLVAGGMTYKQVGHELGLSERTVKYYMGQTLSSLHLRDRAAAVVYARTHGIGAHS